MGTAYKASYSPRSRPFSAFPVRSAVSPLSVDVTLVVLASADAATLSPAPWTGRMEVEEKQANVGSPRTVVVSSYVGALTRVLGCGEEDAQRCFSEASWDNHLGFRCNINGESFRELGGALCFWPVMPEESSSKDHCCLDPALTCQLKADGNALGFSSYVVNNEYWLVQMEKSAVEVGAEENMADFYSPVLTKGSVKNAQVCNCHVPCQDFGFCHQIDEQYVLEQTADKALTGLKGYAYIGYTTEEVSASALKEMDNKRINGAAQTHYPKYSTALLKPLSHEPPDVG